MIRKGEHRHGFGGDLSSEQSGNPRGELDRWERRVFTPLSFHAL